MTIPLQRSIIYGPVRSRRLGSSLGINLLSTKRKECSFNCLYCQYGWSPHLPDLEFGSRTPAGDVFEAVEATLGSLPLQPRYITFSGNGEPTLHPDFPAIVEGIINLRNRLSPGSNVAVLSNASTVDRPAVQTALSGLDVRIMKLDVGREETLRRFNRVIRDITLEGIVAGLISLGDVTIQALFAKGPEGNYSRPEIRAWIHCLKRIKPTNVQIYTLDRSYSCADIEPVHREELEWIQHRLKETGIGSAVF